MVRLFFGGTKIVGHAEGRSISRMGRRFAGWEPMFADLFFEPPSHKDIKGAQRIHLASDFSAHQLPTIERDADFAEESDFRRFISHQLLTANHQLFFEPPSRKETKGHKG